MTMKKLMAASVLAGALTVGTGAATQAATSHAAPAQTTTDNKDDGDKTGLWGLAGLLGLAGLAGLKRRDRYENNYERTSGARTSTRT